MDIRHVSPVRFKDTAVLALIAGATVIIIVSLAARANLNLKAAITDNPDLAIYVLLPEERIDEIELLRDQELERDYLVETKEGPKFVKLRKIGGEWRVAEVDPLRED